MFFWGGGGVNKFFHIQEELDEKIDTTLLFVC